jgi:hypothetical protein
MGHPYRWPEISDRASRSPYPDLACHLVDLAPEGSLLRRPPLSLRGTHGPVEVLVDGIPVQPVVLGYLRYPGAGLDGVEYHLTAPLVGQPNHSPPLVGVFACMVASSPYRGRARSGILRRDHRVFALSGWGRSPLRGAGSTALARLLVRAEWAGARTRGGRAERATPIGKLPKPRNGWANSPSTSTARPRSGSGRSVFLRTSDRRRSKKVA